MAAFNFQFTVTVHKSIGDIRKLDATFQCSETGFALYTLVTKLYACVVCYVTISTK